PGRARGIACAVAGDRGRPCRRGGARRAPGAGAVDAVSEATMAETSAAGSAGKPLERARRLVVKIGSALLVDEAGQVRRPWLEALASDIATLRASGCEVVIVSSGAIAVGRRLLGLTRGTPKLEEKQAAAAIGQIRLAHAY